MHHGAELPGSQLLKSQMQVKMVRRGHTSEADKLLDYLVGSSISRCWFGNSFDRRSTASLKLWREGI